MEIKNVGQLRKIIENLSDDGINKQMNTIIKYSVILL